MTNEYTIITPMSATLVSLSGDDIAIKVDAADAMTYLKSVTTTGKPVLFYFEGYYISPASYDAPNIHGKLLASKPE